MAVAVKGGSFKHIRKYHLGSCPLKTQSKTTTYTVVTVIYHYSSISSCIAVPSDSQSQGSCSSVFHSASWFLCLDSGRKSPTSRLQYQETMLCNYVTHVPHRVTNSRLLNCWIMIYTVPSQNSPSTIALRTTTHSSTTP